LPHVEAEHLTRFYNNKPKIDCLPKLLDYCERNNPQQVLDQLLGDLMDRNQLRDMAQMIAHLPQIEVRLSISGSSIPDKRASAKAAKKSEDSSQETTMNLLVATSKEGLVYELQEDEEYVLNVDLSRLNNNTRSKAGNVKGARKAWTPKYPKPKDENWVVLLGNESDLVGLKRLSAIKSHQQMHILFRTPEVEDDQAENNSLDLTLYLMSDVYLGMDQQYELKFRLKKKK
jgi:activating signal cointegrator complex subunit 3